MVRLQSRRKKQLAARHRHWEKMGSALPGIPAPARRLSSNASSCSSTPLSQGVMAERGMRLPGGTETQPAGDTRSLATVAREPDPTADQTGCFCPSKGSSALALAAQELPQSEPSTSAAQHLGPTTPRLHPGSACESEYDGVRAREETRAAGRDGFMIWRKASEMGNRAEKDIQKTLKTSRVPFVRLVRLKFQLMPGQEKVSRLMLCRQSRAHVDPTLTPGGRIASDPRGSRTTEACQHRERHSEGMEKTEAVSRSSSSSEPPQQQLPGISGLLLSPSVITGVPPHAIGNHLESDPGAQPAPEQVLESEPQPELELESEPQPESELEPDPEPHSELDSEFKSELQSNTNLCLESGPGFESEPDVHLEPGGGSEPRGENEVEMENEDFCAVCLNGGYLLCCDRCPKVFHLHCHIPSLLSFPTGDWVCTLCRDVRHPEVEYDCEIPLPSTECTGRVLPDRLSACDRRRCEKLTLLISCNTLSAPFHEPVSPLARHYYQIIKKPMDLSVIRSKLCRKSPSTYYSPEEFVADVFLMFRNCAKFNYPDSEVALAGRSLEAFFFAKLREVFPEKAFLALDDDSDSDDYDGVPWPDRKDQCHRKRKRRHPFNWSRPHF